MFFNAVLWVYKHAYVFKLKAKKPHQQKSLHVFTKIMVKMSLDNIY